MSDSDKSLTKSLANLIAPCAVKKLEDLYQKRKNHELAFSRGWIVIYPMAPGKGQIELLRKSHDCLNEEEAYQFGIEEAKKYLGDDE